MTEEQFNTVRQRASFYLATYDVWREGQAYFNALHDLFPDIANEIRGGEFDMFEYDLKIDLFERAYSD